MSHRVRTSPRILSFTLLLLAAFAVASCSGDAPTSPLLADDLAAAAGASLPGVDGVDDGGDTDGRDSFDDVFGGEFSDFGPDDIDPSDREYDGEDGPFEHVIRAPNGLELVFRFGGRIRAREDVSIRLRIPGDGKAVRGKVTVDFGDGRRVKDFEINRFADLVHKYNKDGKYRIFVVLVSDDGRQARGGFRLTVHDKIVIQNFDISPVDQLKPDEDSMLEIVAETRLGANRARGTLFIEWGDGTAEVVEKFTNKVTLPHRYKAEGDYDVTLRLDVNGREFTANKTLTVSDLGGGDEFDLRQATIMGNSAGDIANWTITSQITGVSISQNQICQFHTKAGQWPVWSGVEGNPWIVANIGGHWYAGTYEWVRPGQECKGITAGNIGPHIKFPPMSSWRPRAGETVYVFMSTISRLGARSTNERSNVVKVIWPY